MGFSRQEYWSGVPLLFGHKKRNEALISATAQMILEVMMLSEKKSDTKGTYYVIPLIGNSKIGKSTDREGRLVVSRSWREDNNGESLVHEISFWGDEKFWKLEWRWLHNTVKVLKATQRDLSDEFYIMLDFNIILQIKNQTK